MGQIELSVIVPAYNEADGLPRIVSRLNEILPSLVESYEIVLVNDGSADETESVLAALARSDERIRPVNLARNFGKEAAMAAGLAIAEGKALVFIDADLQHPPELIVEMLAAWRNGFDVVNAVKRSRGDESMLYRHAAGLFNRMMSRAIGQDMEGASDYKLIDRQVADVLLSCPERKRFFRGMVTWVGFSVKNLEFDVQEREMGITKWSGAALLRYSLTNMLSFSSLPLRVVGYTGFFVAALGFVLLIQTMLHYFFGSVAIGFTTVIAVQILLGGMILLALGVIAVYLSNIYDEQKARPVFIIRKSREVGAPPKR